MTDRHKNTPERRAFKAEQYRRNAQDPAKRPSYLARAKLRTAVAAGKVARGACEICGAENTEGHHDDYAKPLEVRWLCRPHHRELHARQGVHC